MATQIELARQGLRSAVLVSSSITPAERADLDRKGLAYKVSVASNATPAVLADLDSKGLRYFVSVAAGITPAGKTAMDQRGLRYAVLIPPDSVALQAALNQQGLSYLVEVDSSGNSVSGVSAPVNSVAPVASGSLTVGSVLSVTTGTWSNSPTSYTYQWKRAAADIAGATANTYTLVTADIGAMVSCVVTATNAGGSASASSNALGPVVTFLAGLFGADDGFYPVMPGYVFTDTAGTVAASVDGDLIACFKPQYGGLPNLVQATSGLRPQLKNAGGGVWYALGDGVDDVWASAATVTTATEQVLGIAMRRAAERAGQQIRVGTGTAPIHAINSVVSSGRMSGEFRVGTQYTAVPPTTTFPTATDFVVTSKVASATIDCAKDQAAATSSAAVSSVISNVALSFPAAANNADRIYGFALYTGTVGTTERTAIVTALAALQGRAI